MIYTVTLNPAVDYVVQLPAFTDKTVNRTAGEQLFFGGKGINVSLILAQLEIQSTALGFCAGFTGKAIADGIEKKGVKTDFAEVKDGFSRINVKIKSSGGETEINGQGPTIDSEALERFYATLDNIANGDIVVLAGSVPKSLPQDIYENIIKYIISRCDNVKFVVDACGDLLLKTLCCKPLLIKPNNHELGEIFGVRLKTAQDVIPYAKKLKEAGAENVLVSMAGDGSLLIDSLGKAYFCKACKGNVKNSVGAGDSMLAGFLAGLSDGSKNALLMGTASGGATAFSDDLAVKKDILFLYEKLRADESTVTEMI